MKFVYRANDYSGNVRKGTLEAPSLTAAQAIIQEKKWILLEMHESASRFFPVQWRTAFVRVRVKDIVIFSRQLAVLISATVPIVHALRILARQAPSHTLRNAIMGIAEEVDGGARLSAALSRHGRIFDDFFVAMVRAGETTGRLDDVLTYLANQKEQDYELTSRILIGLIYPFFIIGVLIVMFVVMMIFVVPKLLDILVATGAALPLTTRFLVGVSGFMQYYWWLLLILAIALFATGIYAASVPQGRLLLDRLRLHLPIIGNIYAKIYLTRISRSLANLLAAGVPVNRALIIASDIVGNAVFQQLLLKAEHDVESGMTLSDSFHGHAVIPAMMVQMMAVGEETGRLDHILSKVSEFYSHEVSALTRALTSLIEPIIIIFLGVAVMIVLMGILVPMYSVTANI